MLKIAQELREAAKQLHAELPLTIKEARIAATLLTAAAVGRPFSRDAEWWGANAYKFLTHVYSPGEHNEDFVDANTKLVRALDECRAQLDECRQAGREADRETDRMRIERNDYLATLRRCILTISKFAGDEEADQALLRENMTADPVHADDVLSDTIAAVETELAEARRQRDEVRNQLCSWATDVQRIMGDENHYMTVSDKALPLHEYVWKLRRKVAAAEHELSSAMILTRGWRNAATAITAIAVFLGVAAIIAISAYVLK